MRESLSLSSDSSSPCEWPFLLGKKFGGSLGGNLGGTALGLGGRNLKG